MTSCYFVLKNDQQVRNAILRYYKIIRDDQKGKNEMHKFESDAYSARFRVPSPEE